ncbi:MAG: phosphoglycolate phosphatase [Burkholderiaceae bacterium]|nr:phosphoglycolate phosphatase [Roseateles sp.]MBV8468853.1 phosphoglycolate phosphatase [Burkholderiaceae bacterium]
MSTTRQDASGIRAVLFDLDGTLIDSAPDLAGAANEMRSVRGLEPLPYEHLRPMVGSGARGMLAASLQVAPDHDEFDALRHEFLHRYEQRMLQATYVFESVRPLLEELQRQGVPWGIVTNKAERFALPVTRALGLFDQAACVVGGDTTPHSKPHPEPLLEAARRLNLPASQCVYVGDDERDMLAGHAAGMLTVAAAWGYLGHEAQVDRWGANFVIEHPLELLSCVQLL